jgi:adenylylsulfate kinase
MTVASRGGVVVWFTGLSGAGKSTLATGVAERLHGLGIDCELLDGDVVRTRLSRGLGYTRDDRNENIARIGFVAELLARHGIVVLVSAISPYREARDLVRSRTPGTFVEVYVAAPLSVCERRDPKGLYQKARAGEITHFTGIDDPYEPPLAPEVTCRTDVEEVDESVEKVLAVLRPLLTGAGSAKAGG